MPATPCRCSPCTVASIIRVRVSLGIGTSLLTSTHILLHDDLASTYVLARPVLEGILMPITVTAPRGVLTAAGQREVLPRLTAALIEASGLTGNAFFTSIVGG